METPNKAGVGSKGVTQIMRPSILMVVLLFALLDITSSARPNPSGFQSSYRLEGSILETPVELFDAELNRDVVLKLQSQPQDELYGERVLLSCTCTEDDCPAVPRNGRIKPDCGR